MTRINLYLNYDSSLLKRISFTCLIYSCHNDKIKINDDLTMH